jgi:hypothetical protein
MRNDKAVTTRSRAKVQLNVDGSKQRENKTRGEENAVSKNGYFQCTLVSFWHEHDEWMARMTWEIASRKEDNHLI